jgi:NRAMP (natural resistance-associated macrophage protein)-like metal ion transporter
VSASTIRVPKARAPKNFFDSLGPGLVTGAADDDPSGISTCSVAGATYGYATLWTALITFPLMTAVQMMCAQLGLVTGRGLAHGIRLRYSCWVLWGACVLLAVANITNLGADLGGMAKVTGMMLGVSPLPLTLAYAVLVVFLLFWSSYRHIARIFKWLSLVLFAYVVAAFLARPDWHAVLTSSLIPHIRWNREFLSVLVAILGTTISPYLFFWHAAQEVEDQRANGLAPGRKLKVPAARELRALRTDVVTGMLFSNVIMYFIILTTAATLHAHGKNDIETAKEAAEALLPLAGNGAYWLFSLGVIGTGMLAVPVLAGSCAYAIAEAAAWRGTLDVPPGRAHGFYAVIGSAVSVGFVLNFAHLNAVRMLFWSAVVNGVLAPPLILLVVLMTSDRRVMGEAVVPPLVRWLGWITFVAMAAAAIGMFVT